LGRVEVGPKLLEIAITAPRRRRLNPRLIAPLAFLVAFTAIALELAYTIGHFFSQTVQQIP
jgi:hypothetical protein